MKALVGTLIPFKLLVAVVRKASQLSTAPGALAAEQLWSLSLRRLLIHLPHTNAKWVAQATPFITSCVCGAFIQETLS